MKTILIILTVTVLGWTLVQSAFAQSNLSPIGSASPVSVTATNGASQVPIIGLTGIPGSPPGLIPVQINSSSNAVDTATEHPLIDHPLGGHVPAVTANLEPIGRLQHTDRLNLAIGLPLRDPTGLSSFLEQIYDPTGPNFGYYLTPEQFTQAFGPTEGDYEAVVNFAKANGFTITGTHANRMLLDVSGTVGDIERAFNVVVLLYQHPSEPRTFYAPNAEPSVPSSVPVLDISGLDNYWPPHPSHVIRGLDLSAVPAVGTGPGGQYIGQDFRVAYANGVAQTGTGEKVGLFEFDGYYTSDITAYESQAGLPNVPLQNVLIDGFNGIPAYAGSVVEVSLDIEMAISMAPGLSSVIVYEAPPNGGNLANDVLNRMATDNAARQLSCSWVWTGPLDTTHQILLQMAAQGQSFFQASGDGNAWCNIWRPCDDPNACVVGGTTLTMNGSGLSYASETVWNWGPGGWPPNVASGYVGSGGGISTHYSIPGWQTGIDMTANQGSTTMRNIPDVAMVADQVYVIANQGQSYNNVGGTSIAAPLWAGFTALINQYALANGRTQLGFPNPALYAAGKGSSYSLEFHDITTGNNQDNCSPTMFLAVSGYDLCTGWGSPVGQATISALTCTAPASGMVAWWKAEHNPNDETGNNNGAGSVMYVPGRVGQAFSFDGVAQEVQVADSPSLDPTTGVTLEGWIFPTRYPTNDAVAIAGKDNPYGTRQYLLGYANVSGQWVLRAHIGLPGGLIYFNDGTPILRNTWYHVAMTYDGSYLRLYVNGAPTAYVPATGPINSSNDQLIIGGSVLGGPNWNFPGFVDEFSVYNRALTSTEVARIYSAGASGKCPCNCAQ